MSSGEIYGGTYKALLGPLGAKPVVWAACLFVDPIADIAVLGQPDNQVLIDEAAAFDALMDSTGRLAIADASAQGREGRGAVELSTGNTPNRTYPTSEESKP